MIDRLSCFTLEIAAPALSAAFLSFIQSSAFYIETFIVADFFVPRARQEYEIFVVARSSIKNTLFGIRRCIESRLNGFELTVVPCRVKNLVVNILNHPGAGSIGHSVGVLRVCIEKRVEREHQCLRIHFVGETAKLDTGYGFLKLVRHDSISGFVRTGEEYNGQSLYR